jgi:ADP-heptose:LPS heptosyltransferase
MGKGPIIMYSLSGSSVHKVWPGLDNVIASAMLHFPEAFVVLVGGPECVILEQGWEKEDRVIKTSGKWSMRQSMAFLDQVDLVIGPETGTLNAAAFMSVPKVIFLSHSSEENLTRDWVNTTALYSKTTICPGRTEGVPACHQMHYGWDYCLQDKVTSTAQCQADIQVQDAWNAIAYYLLNPGEEKAA